MKTVFGKNRLTIYFNFIGIFLALLLPATPAWAVIATITGGSANSANPTQVKVGDSLYITGSCKQENWHETRGWARYFVKNSSGTKQLSGSSIVSWLDNSSQNVVVGTTPYTDGKTFEIALQCTDHIQKAFTASAFFEVIQPSAPTVTADISNALFAKDTILIKVHAASTGDGVKDVFILWPGAPTTSESMTHVSGDLYQYTIDVRALPEGPADLKIWATSDGGANRGWEEIRGFTVDHNAPTLGATSVSQSGNLATVSIPVTDSASGVKNVWMRWQTDSGWSSDTAMNKVGSAEIYRYSINTRGMPSRSRSIQIWARDNSGLDTNWVDKGSFSVSHPAPTIAWDKSNAKFASEKILVRAQVKAAAGFSVAQTWIWWSSAPSDGYQMQDEGGGTYSYAIPTAGLPDGVAQNVMFWAKDNDGTVRSWITPAGSSFTVDRTPPAIAIQSAPNHKVLNQDLAFVLSISDSVSGLDQTSSPQICWTQKNADGSWPDCTHPENLKPGGGGDYLFTIPLAKLRDGDVKVMFNAQDKLGNSHFLSNGAWPDGPHFIIDKTRPVIDWQTPIDKVALTGDSVRITGTVTDDNPDVIVIKWQAENDTAWHTHTIPIGKGNAFEYDLSGLVQGVNYRMFMQATDKAGNLSDETDKRTVIGQLPANTLFRNPLFFIAEESLVDKDDSGGFSRGDDVIYTLALETGKYAALNASLQYVLPAGLAMTPGAHPYFATGNDIGDDAKLNAHWNGVGDTQLLADNANLKANGKLLIHIPVTLTVQSSATSPIISTVRAGAKNAKDELTLTYALALQAKFPAHRALTLELASLQPNWKYAQGTLFDYRIAVHLLDWDLNAFTLDYALPPGLEKHGEARIEEAGTSASDSTFTSALALNPAWGKNGVKLLLSSTPGAVLAARHSFTVIIPVMVSATAAGSVLRSKVEAHAGNLSGPVSAMHRIVVDGSGGDPEEQLTLKKTVDKQTALRGQTLRYTITYSNVGIDELHDLVIRDAIQDEYLTLQSAQCGPIIPRTIKCRAVPLEHGWLEWHLDGKLEAGDSGSVRYEVRINEN